MNSTVPNLKDGAHKMINAPKGVTTLFLTDLSKGNLVVPKPIPWDQLSFPDSWKIEDAVPLKKEENSQIDYVFEEPDGSVILKFDKQRSLSSRRSFSRSIKTPTYLPPRASTSSIPIKSGEEVKATERLSDNVVKPLYERPNSPSMSDMGYYSVNMISKDLNPFEKWYTVTFSEREKTKWNNKYDLYMFKMNNEGSKSFPEFIKHMLYLKGKKSEIKYPDFENLEFLETLETSYKTFLTPQGESIKIPARIKKFDLDL